MKFKNVSFDTVTRGLVYFRNPWLSKFKPSMVKSFFNVYPPYRGVGARVVHVSDDFLEIVVELSLNWRNRNIMGTMFGGSMYAAADPIFMTILMENLGPEYVVWDKAATIYFKKPGRTDMRARFAISREEIESIKRELEGKRSVDRVYSVDMTDAEGAVCATVEKTLYVRKR